MTDFDKYYEATEPGYRERAIGGLHRRDVVINRDDVVINVVIKLTLTEESTTKAILRNPRITAAELATQLSVTKRQAERVLASLKTKANLKRRGSRKTGEWYFES